MFWRPIDPASITPSCWIIGFIIIFLKWKFWGPNSWLAKLDLFLGIKKKTETLHTKPKFIIISFILPQVEEGNVCFVFFVLEEITQKKNLDNLIANLFRQIEVCMHGNALSGFCWHSIGFVIMLQRPKEQRHDAQRSKIVASVWLLWAVYYMTRRQIYNFATTIWRFYKENINFITFLWQNSTIANCSICYLC